MLRRLVPAEGVEPTRPCGHLILSQACLPFHHAGTVARYTGRSAQRVGGSVLSGRIGLSPGAEAPSPRASIGRARPGLADRHRRDARPVDAVRPAPPAEDPEQRLDMALIERAREGELEAFNGLVVRHQDHLYALVARMVPDRDQAGDAVQEAFFNAYRNLATFRGGSVRSWLSRIAVNAAMDAQRYQRRRPAFPYPEFEDDSWQPPAGEEADPERIVLEAERGRALAEALARLTSDQRAAIVLFDVEGYDYSEIATLTGVSLGTVKSRIHRGRLALRALLETRRELFRG